MYLTYHMATLQRPRFFSLAICWSDLMVPFLSTTYVKKIFVLPLQIREVTSKFGSFLERIVFMMKKDILTAAQQKNLFLELSDSRVQQNL